MNIDHFIFKKAAPPRWLVFALIFLSPLPTYAAPTFTTTATADIKHSSLTLNIQTDATGKAYYVVLADSATAPDADQVKAGTDQADADVDPNKKGVVTLTADTEASSYIIGLDPNIPYDIYVVAENSSETLNTPVKVDVTTAAAPTDTTAPVFDDLGNPITLGETTIDFTVKTDEDGKAYYVVLDNDATVPADSQIKNGQESDNTDVDDTKKGELTLTANTGSVASVTGLIANTAYDIYVIAEDTEGNVTTGKIDVLLDSIAPEFATDYPKVENITDTTAELKIQSNENGKAYYVRLDGGATAPTDVKTEANKVEVTLTADTEATENITGLTEGATYDVYIMVEDDAGNMTTTADSYPLTFTTTGGTGDITGDYDNTGNTITASDTITGTTTITGGTLDGTFDFTASGLDVTLNNVTLAASASINGGRLEGTITGDAGNPAILTNVTIGANAILINVIIGDGVTFEPGVTLENVKFEGANITVEDVTFKGTITVIETSITIFTNVQFGIGFTALTGGTLSGEIQSETGFSGSASLTGLTFKNVIDFKAIGISVSNATFEGSFTATSTVTITNITFGVSFTRLTGGILSGTIATVAGFSGSASLTGLTFLNVTSFNVVNISVTNVILQGTFTTTSTILITNVKLAAGVAITGTGISLGGTIQPETGATITLTNLKIADNSIVLKGITLGSGVTKGTDVQDLTGTTLTTVTTNVTYTSTTIIKNIIINPGVTITGGTLEGNVIGDPINPPTLENVTITAGTILSNVILSSTVVIPATYTFSIGIKFTQLPTDLDGGFNLTSIFQKVVVTTIVGLKQPSIPNLDFEIIKGTGTVLSKILNLATKTTTVFGAGAKIKIRKGRLKIKLAAKPGKRPAMCGFRPSRVGKRGGRRRSLRAAADEEYGYGNVLYTADEYDVETVSLPSVQNLEALTAALKDKGFTDIEELDNANIKATDSDGKTIIFRPSITSEEVDASTPLGFKDDKLFKDSNGKVSFIFDDVDEEDDGTTTTTRREQVLYATPAILDDITDATLNTQNDQMGGSYPEDGQVSFTYNGITYAGTFDWFVTTGGTTRTAMAIADLGDSNGNGNKDYQITYTDGTKQKLFTSTPITSGGVSTGGSSTGDDTTDDDTTGDDETDTNLSGIIDNTGKSLKDITFAANAEIKGGTLEGNIAGSANGFAKLDNLKIAANAILNNVSLGKNVTFGAGVTLKDVLFMGASLSDVILKGTIRTASSATVITNPTLGDNAKIIGGKLAGIIKGNRAARALLQSIVIEADSKLTNLLIGSGVDIPVTASLGEGVQFTAVENIPVNLDLSGILSSFAALVPEVEQPAALDLSGKPVENGESLLVNINNLAFFADNGWKLDQSDKAGNLTLKVESLRFEVIPVKVKRVESNTRAVDEPVRLGFGTSVYFTNEDGIEVEAHPLPQDVATLQALLAAIQIPKFQISKEGNIQVPINETTWISGRAELASKPAEEGDEVGFKFQGDLVVLVFEKDGQKLQQVLYAAPASNAAIKLAEEASLTEQGILSFKFGETTYTGKLDYFVENGEATESYGITEIADSNGDGLPDYLMTYPQGYKQKLFALPPATE